MINTGLALLAIVLVMVAILKRYLLAQAHQKYKAALAALSADPDNNAKSIAALAAGRAYARTARAYVGQKGIAIFDEVALQNDLAARRGKGSTSPQPAAPASGTHAGPAPGTDRSDQLVKLAGLHEKGLLSKDEFEREKRRLLDS